MKIERKIFLSSIVYLSLIIIVGAFAIQNLNTMSAELRFLEIADGLNASFLQMRLSEKNYFLFSDKTAISDIETNISQAEQTMDSSRSDIVRVIGEPSYDELRTDLSSYRDAVAQADAGSSTDLQLETSIRDAGRKLKDFSDGITGLERDRASEIITRSKWLLFLSFIVVLVLAAVVSRLVSRKIVAPIKQIEQMAKSISAGNFHKLDTSLRRDEFGPVIWAINTMSEELEKREDEIIQSKKLASLGILIAGVAHELNNPVNNISMIAQTYDDMYDKLSREQRLEFMATIDQESERIRRIVTNLLDFSKPREPQKREVGINTVIQRALELVQNSLDINNIETRLDLGDNLPDVFIDDNQIQQVLVNLLTNAAQAMPGSGVLRVQTTAETEQGTVEITIKDTGKGIPPEYLPHIFDPFFSTKEEGGTGLGLSVSYGIVKNHGGSIHVSSTVGVGTIFTIDLPAAK